MEAAAATTAAEEPRGSGDEERTRLKRAIGPGLLTLFVVGDILGAGIYALVGEVGAEVGGAIWAPFMAAFVLAVLTAFAYAELVSKYPRAGGSAHYTHRAFGRPLFTFVVAFAGMSSRIASPATLSRAFAGDYLKTFVDLPLVGRSWPGRWSASRSRSSCWSPRSPCAASPSR